MPGFFPGSTGPALWSSSSTDSVSHWLQAESLPHLEMLSLGKRKVPELGRVLIQRTFFSGFSKTSTLTSLPPGKDPLGSKQHSPFQPLSSYRLLADKKPPADKKPATEKKAAEEKAKSDVPELVLYDAPVEKLPSRNKGNAGNAPKLKKAQAPPPPPPPPPTTEPVAAPVVALRTGPFEVTLEEISEAFAQAEAEAEAREDESHLAVLDDRSVTSNSQHI
jgi:hypothetical protein